MLIKHLKKIVITDLLSLCSLMLIGCRQPGANMVEQVASGGSVKKPILQNAFSEKKVKFTKDNVDVMVRYKVKKNDKLYPYRFKSASKSEFDAGLLVQEKTNQDEHQLLFNLFAELIPHKYRKDIIYCHIFNDKFVNAQMCNQMDIILDKFSLGMQFNLRNHIYCIDNDFLRYPYVFCVMLHEFGHYLELHNDQRYFLLGFPRVIVKKRSIIRQFKAMSESNTGRKEAYVSSYAMTSWDEDFADTFVYFVLLDECPERDVSIPGNKVRLFYEYSKMVEIRAAIRANLKKLGIHPNMSRDELKQLDIYPSNSNTN